MLKVKRLSIDAKIPQYQTSGSSGFDISTIEDIQIGAGQRMIARTGLIFDIPKGYEIQIRPRSGLAAKHGITVLNAPGTIDQDYTDEVKIILFNTSDKPWNASKGDRICQGVLAPVVQMDIVEIAELDDNAIEKDRGGGFGSTGVK